MDAAIAIGVIVGLLLLFLWGVNGVVSEAERKIGRQLTFMEMLLGCLTLPYSAIFVLWVLEDQSTKKKRR